MRNPRTLVMAVASALCLSGLSAQAQNSGLAFSLTAGLGVAPSYFGSSSYRVGPSGSLGFNGLRMGGLQIGDPDSTDRFAPGTGIGAAFRYIGARRGRDELAGLADVSSAVELGLRLRHTASSWQVYAELRRGVTGHSGWAGELGANAILRSQGGFVFHAGPRAEYGDGRFMRTYFGVTPAEAGRSNLSAHRPGGGLASVGFEIGGYQPLNDDWGITGSLRLDRLQRGAAASPIVQQGRRDQARATIGLTRHLRLGF